MKTSSVSKADSMVQRHMLLATQCLRLFGTLMPRRFFSRSQGGGVGFEPLLLFNISAYRPTLRPEDNYRTFTNNAWDNIIFL